MEIPDGFAQANLKFGGPAAPEGAEITIGLDLALTSATPVEVAEAVAAAWDASVAHQQSSSLNFDSVYVKFGPGNTGPSGEASGTGGLYASASAVPPQVSVIVNKGTALGGRSGRGRMFVPGIPEGSVTPAGLIDGGVQSDWNTDLIEFATALAGDDLSLVLLHGPDSPVTVPTPITSLIVSAKVGTQRDRLRR